MKRLRTSDDEGSVMLLAIGYGLLALVVVLICASATSLYLAQKRVDAVADAAALAAVDGFEFVVIDGEPAAHLSDDGVRAQAAAIVAASDTDTALVRASSPDGVSARVTVAGAWHPPMVTLFVPDGVALEATSTSRIALR